MFDNVNLYIYLLSIRILFYLVHLSVFNKLRKTGTYVIQDIFFVPILFTN